ncbi:MAG: type II 3-dehydroquinate dehydratase [Epulopiscium sp. Nuni2H_MBin003]|nr:MAG: type II 3-dehydroquinate dehydratase [Epulopiscium sp. Nuni2H_MBin003]
MNICIINGPNLNFLGIREPEIYGKTTLIDITEQITSHAKSLGIDVTFFQSNIEGEIVNKLQQCYHDKVDGIIINPGAFTHYSYALTDAIKSINIDTVEVHISNIYKREEFRQHSVTAGSCVGVISGFGVCGYKMALNYFSSL